jgi:hypothetical protein
MTLYEWLDRVNLLKYYPKMYQQGFFLVGDLQYLDEGAAGYAKLEIKPDEGKRIMGILRG